MKKDGEEINLGNLADKRKIVIVINNQITFAPNTTQIASGAGQNSAAGSNAAIDSSNTRQQETVGAGGEAINKGISGDQIEPHKMKKKLRMKRQNLYLSSIIKLIKPVRNRLVLLKWQVVVEKTVQREPTLPSKVLIPNSNMQWEAERIVRQKMQVKKATK